MHSSNSFLTPPQPLITIIIFDCLALGMNDQSQRTGSHWNVVCLASLSKIMTLYVLLTSPTVYVVLKSA